MSESIGNSIQKDELIRDCLQDSPNSLKNQSAKRLKHPTRDGISQNYHIEDLLNTPQNGNDDGWGIIGYKTLKGPPSFIQKSLHPAYQDPQFSKAVSNLITQHPQVILAHLMKKPKERANILNNLHPFTYENWSGMLNGNIRGSLTEIFQNRLKNEFGPLLGELPKGTTAGEIGFYNFLGKLKQRYGTVDGSSIGIDNLRRTFAETMRELIASSKEESRPLTGEFMGIEGKVQQRPITNFIMTDGENLLAFCRLRKLYLTRHENHNGKYSYLIASEPIQPKDHRKSLKWLEIPPNHILSLSKDKGRNIKPYLAPLFELTPLEEVTQ